MFNMKKAKKPIAVNVDTKNFDVKFIKENGKTWIEVDTEKIDITYSKDGNIRIFKFDTESDILDVDIRTDENGTTVDVKSSVNWLGKFVAWCLGGKARRAARRAKK